ncbi:ribonuclease H-like domain-containing protein [Tanacetum coccineum]
MLPRVHHPFLLWEGCTQAAKSRYNTRLAQLLPRHIYSPCVVDWNVLNHMSCGEGLLTLDEPILLWSFARFYSTYEFDEVCVDDELRTKKIIKFKIYRRAFSWTLLEFAKRLGLYHSEEIKEEGFDVYFQGGLCSDELFNAREYWLSISREDNLSLSRSHASTIRNPVLRVLHKMITYGLCQRKIGWMKRKGADVLNSLSASIYCKALDTTTLRELIDSESRLIHEAPEPGVPRFDTPRASMQDLYERIGSMEIRQGAIEMMAYRQSYHWIDIMQQYEQYYQQYPPQQQQPDDDE